MVPRQVGRRILRREDERFLRGRGRDVDDIEVAGLFHAAIVHGDVAQGLGSALLEEIVHLDNAQPLTTTFLDDLLGEAGRDRAQRAPSPRIPGGMKGVGERGTIAALAAILNAIARAVPKMADRVTDIPMTPSRRWELLLDEAVSG